MGTRKAPAPPTPPRSPVARAMDMIADHLERINEVSERLARSLARLEAQMDRLDARVKRVVELHPGADVEEGEPPC